MVIPLQLLTSFLPFRYPIILVAMKTFPPFFPEMGMRQHIPLPLCPQTFYGPFLTYHTTSARIPHFDRLPLAFFFFLPPIVPSLLYTSAFFFELTERGFYHIFLPYQWTLDSSPSPPSCAQISCGFFFYGEFPNLGISTSITSVTLEPSSVLQRFRYFPNFNFRVIPRRASTPPSTPLSLPPSTYSVEESVQIVFILIPFFLFVFLPTWKHSQLLSIPLLSFSM